MIRSAAEKSNLKSHKLSDPGMVFAGDCVGQENDSGNHAHQSYQDREFSQRKSY
jgi:hypothetical protein